MTKSTFRVDFRALLNGLKQIEKEREEIQEMLGFLVFTIKELVRRDPRSSDSCIQTGILEMRILPNITDPTRYSLRLSASRTSLGSPMEAELYLFCPDLGREYPIMSGEHLSIGRIPERNIGPWCHRLIHELADELLLRRPEDRDRFKVVYDAAKRVNR